MSFLSLLSKMIAALNKILPSRFNVISIIANQVGLIADMAQVVHITSRSHRK